MKKVLVLLNSQKVGGAERSILELVADQKENCEFTVLKPSFKKNCKEDDFYYPKRLYQLSRSDSVFKFVLATLDLVQFVWSLKNLKMKNFDMVLLNGNKVAYPAMFYCCLRRLQDLKLCWFWRDYPTNKFFESFLFKNLFNKLSLLLIANSKDVEQSIKKISQSNKTFCLYPMPDRSYLEKKIETVSRIAVPAMFSIWKGVHEVLMMASIYEKELEKRNIYIHIYGDEIYDTVGEHTGIKEEFLKLKSSRVQFCGLVSPEEIYEKADLLIHPSIKKEPFGRVIIESFSSKTPVISTALGGASEQILNYKTGLKYFPSDYHMLFQKIIEISENEKLRNDLIDVGYTKDCELKKENEQTLSLLFNI